YQYILKPLEPLNTYWTITGLLSAKRILLLVVLTVCNFGENCEGLKPLPTRPATLASRIPALTCNCSHTGIC
ncbi:unnamed protein product, partial [Porites evermanni]